MELRGTEIEKRLGSVPSVSEMHDFVLIVEDDLSYRPFWEAVLGSLNKQFVIQWATKMSEAENLIRDLFKGGKKYFLVVCDINLEGEESGIEVWNRYGELVQNFLFVSGLSISRTELMYHLKFGSPAFLKKPLDFNEVKAVLASLSQQNVGEWGGA